MLQRLRWHVLRRGWAALTPTETLGSSRWSTATTTFFSCHWNFDFRSHSTNYFLHQRGENSFNKKTSLSRTNKMLNMLGLRVVLTLVVPTELLFWFWERASTKGALYVISCSSRLFHRLKSFVLKQNNTPNMSPHSTQSQHNNVNSVVLSKTTIMIRMTISDKWR